jgi:hypothetical protein
MLKRDLSKSTMTISYLRHVIITNNRLRCQRCYKPFSSYSFIVDTENVRFRSVIAKPKSEMPIIKKNLKTGLKLGRNKVLGVEPKIQLKIICSYCGNSRIVYLTDCNS